MRTHVKYSNTDNLTHTPQFICSCMERKQKKITEKADENRLKTHISHILAPWYHLSQNNALMLVCKPISSSWHHQKKIYSFLLYVLFLYFWGVSINSWRTLTIFCVQMMLGCVFLTCLTHFYCCNNLQSMKSIKMLYTREGNLLTNVGT